MPEPRDIPMVRWGEALRRERNARRRGRFRIAATALSAVAATAAVATAFWPPRAKLVWNSSSSSPVGLYSVSEPRGVGPGEMVVAWAPEGVRSLAAERRYLPLNVPLVKRVAASAGDRVCAIGEAILVNGTVEAFRRIEDPSGRPLPWWTGCEDLRDGELFLLAPESAASFDGRYFGITRAREVVGRARLIWPT